MKKTLLIPVLILVSILSHSQFIHKIKADSVLITNDSCTAELNLENSTKNVNGFLYNKGSGRTEFRKAMIKVNDSIYVFGGDTLKVNPVSYAASNGITLAGSDFQLGGTVTNDKIIKVRNNEFRIMNTIGNAPFRVSSVDTITNGGSGTAYTVGFSVGRDLHFPSYSGINYKGGAGSTLVYRVKDSMQATTIGGGFGFANQSSIVLEKMAGYSGRSVYMGGDGVSLTEGVPVQSNNLTLQHSTSTTSNYRYAKGYWVGNRSYLVMGSNDTLQKWVGFDNMGFVPGGKLDYTFDYVGGHFGGLSSAIVTNPWFLYGHSTRSKSLISGPTGFGDSTIEASALIDASSTTKGVIWPRMTTVQKNAIASPATGLIVFDTDLVQYNFWDGDSWEAMGSGGGGSSMAIGGAITGSPNEKSLLFVGTGGVLAQNTNLIFDSTNKYLGVNMGSVAPSDFLQVGGTTGSIQFGGANGRTITARNAANDGYSNFDFIANSVSFDSKLEVLSVGGVSGKIELYEGTAGTTTDGALEHITDNLNFTSGTTRYIIPKTLVASATLDFPNTTSNNVADLTITVTGAALGDAVSLGIPNASVTPTATFSAWVSAANTVKIRFSPKATENPASGTFKVSVIK